MNLLKTRYLLLVPVIALALNACAKRDSNFGKKTRAGVEKTTGKPTDADTLVDANGDRGSIDQKGTSDSAENEFADGATSYSEQCINPVVMDVVDGDDPMTIDELVKETKGTYSLVNTHYFVETEAKEGEAKRQLYALGSEYQTPADLSKAVTDTKKIFVNCHTVKPTETKDNQVKMRGSVDLPNSFDTETGVGKVIRQDAIRVVNGSLQTLTTLYAGNFDLKDKLGEGKPADMKVLIVKNADEVTIKMKYTRTERTGQKSTITSAGTYKLVKAEAAKDEEASKEDSKDAKDAE